MNKKNYLKSLLLLAMMLIGAGSASAVDVTTTYIFGSREWTATCNGDEANWIVGLRASGFTAGQGTQITTSATGANATSPISFTDVKKITVTYCTNSRAGKGDIKVKVGSGTEQSFNVSAPSSGGTSLKTTDFTFEPYETGAVKLTVDCTTNSIYIYSIAITTETNLIESDLSLSPVALNFDMYDNSATQTISYTTSSSGAISVSENEYVNTEVGNGTISVTPIKTTPTEQTITVYQAATDTYAAGSASFTVSIGDSTPFEGGDVTFVAGTDKGTTTGTGPDEMTKSGVTISSTSAALGTTEYRLYSGSTTTISTSSGKITKIQFTQSSNSYPVSKLSTETGNYNGTSGIWVGEATSVDFSASAQVRASQIVVTVSVSNKQSAGLVYETTEYTVNLGENFTTPNLTNPNNLPVTYSSSNENVATVANDGAVSILAAGTTTITASFSGNDSFEEGSASYSLNIIDPNAPGSENNPFSVSDAIAAVNNNTYAPSQEYYISGIVSGFYGEGDDILDDSFHRYYISDDGTTTTQLVVYNGKGLNNVAFSNADDLLVGDEVVIVGKLMVYNNAPEVAANNYIVSLNRQEVKYYLAGSWGENNYGWGEGMEQLTKSGNTYTIDKNLANGTLFKIVKVDETNGNETTWYGGPADGEWFGVSETVCENLTLSSSGKNFKIDGACDDHFTFTVDATNPDNLTLTVTGWHVPEVKYYLAGNWSENWDDGKVELTANADGTFSTSKLVGNGSRFKFVKTVDGAETWYGATQSGDDYGINSGWCTNIGLSDAGNSSAFVIQMASDNELVFKLNPTDMTFNVTGWPISIEGNMFVKVTSDADFTDGAYLIVNETAGVAFNGGLETLDVANNIISVTIDNGKIEATDANKAALFTIVNNGKITSASGHYIGVSDYANSLKVDGDATMYENSVSIDNGNADIAIYTGTSGYVHLKYNKASDQNRFRYYKSGQQPIQLYKLVTVPMNDIVITSAEWATYVPNLAVTIPEDVTAYIVTNATSTSVTLSSVASAPANTGLVVNGDEGTYTPTAAETTDDVSGNLLVVSDGTVVGNGNIYALGNKNGSVGFKKVKSGVTVPAGKPYLTIESSGSKDFFDFSFDEGVATGIESVESIGFDMNAPVYDLQGRQVNRLHKGVFIQNGKKIIVK